MANIIGDRIKKMRELRGLTQDMLGNAIGVTGVSIMRYEKGARSPSVEQLLEISKILDVPISYLSGQSDSFLPVPKITDDSTINRLASEFAAKLYTHMNVAKRMDAEENRRRGYETTALSDKIAYHPKNEMIVVSIADNAIHFLDEALDIILSEEKLSLNLLSDDAQDADE